MWLQHPGDQLSSLWDTHRLDQSPQKGSKPLCPLPKGLLLRPGKGGSEISVGQQTALPVTKGRTILQRELLKSNLAGGKAVLLECKLRTCVLHVQGHRAAETPKHWTGPHTHHIQWHGWKSCSPSYQPKPSDFKTRHECSRGSEQALDNQNTGQGKNLNKPN